MRTPLAWRNVAAKKARSLVALCGIGFAIVLIFMQLGFRAAARTNATSVYEALDFDVIVLSPQYTFLAQPSEFPRRRLENIRSAADVISAIPLWVRLGEWRNPKTRECWNVLALGAEPSAPAFRDQSITKQIPLLTVADTALGDSLARPEQGHPHAGMNSEVQNHRMRIVGQYRIGGGFAAGSTLVMSRATFLETFKNSSPDYINAGLVNIRAGASAASVADQLKKQLWPEAIALTRDELFHTEQTYWLKVKPIGIMFTSGLAVALIAGAVILYQVLATEVQNRIREYATLKAIGYGNEFVYGVVIRQALLFSVLGFVPAFFFALLLYYLLRTQALVPVWMEPARVAGVSLLTLFMCLSATFFALRKLRTADPADLF